MLYPSPFPQTILVPQGAEHKAVCRGLRHVTPKPLVVTIPIGSKPVTQYLERWQKTEAFVEAKYSGILVMGLCGSLSPQIGVGKVFLYHNCVCESTMAAHSCDSQLTILLHHKLGEQVALINGLTSDRIITSAPEKRHLGQLYNTQVVDMEGFAILEILASAGVAVAMVRVVSDDTDHNLPNLTSVISSDGSLQPLPLTISLIRQPIAAIYCIQGAIRGLQGLQEVTTRLFSQ